MAKPAPTSKLTHFFLPVTPRPAARPRSVCRGRFAQVYMDPAYREWTEQAKSALAAHRPDAPFLGDVTIAVTAVVTKPKKTVKVRPSGDVDNYAKGVYDAITATGGFWTDDDQITDERVMKRWAVGDEPAGYYITIGSV